MKKFRYDLKPMTSAWFEALMLINAKQAVHAAVMVRTAGTEDCCMICGDQQNVSDIARPSRHSLLFRLCRDCIKIQDDWCSGGPDPAQALGLRPRDSK